MAKIVAEQKSIKSKNVFLLPLIVVIVFVQLLTSAAAPVRLGGKRLVIHIPVQVKMHHHTHTVYSRIRSGETKQTVYKILAYSAHGADEGEAESHRGNTWQHPHDDSSLDYDEHVHRFGGGSNHKTREPTRSAGDMIFNHYSRKDDKSVDYPDMEAYVDEIQWE